MTTTNNTRSALVEIAYEVPRGRDMRFKSFRKVVAERRLNAFVEKVLADGGHVIAYRNVEENV